MVQIILNTGWFSWPSSSTTGVVIVMYTPSYHACKSVRRCLIRRYVVVVEGEVGVGPAGGVVYAIKTASRCNQTTLLL